MNHPINTRLAVLDALGWPIGVAVFVLSLGDGIGTLHGIALLILTIWALRKLGWALDGYREETWFVNPANPVSLLLVLLLRQEGPYSYTTTTLIVWFGAFFLFGCVVKVLQMLGVVSH
jgi:hypothetical protein